MNPSYEEMVFEETIFGPKGVIGDTDVLSRGIDSNNIEFDNLVHLRVI